MKQFLAVLLALVLCLSMGVTAFAAEVSADGVTVTKTYVVGEGGSAPAETLRFSVEFVSGEKDGFKGDLTIGTDNAFETDGKTTQYQIPLNLPKFSKVGIYKWTITENVGSTLGVEYDSVPITVVITITNSEKVAGGLEITVAVHKTASPTKDNKLSEGDTAFENTCETGKLTVTKKVTGNLSSNEKLFTIHVNFSGGRNAGSAIAYTLPDGSKGELAFAADGSAALDIELKHGASAVFDNIPAGVSYTVEEDAKHTKGDLNSDEGYTVSYKNGSGKIAKDSDITATVTNEKKTEIQTGVFLDSLPYILIAAAVVAALVIMIIRKRRSDEDN